MSHLILLMVHPSDIEIASTSMSGALWRETPLISSVTFSNNLNASVYLKLEVREITTSPNLNLSHLVESSTVVLIQVSRDFIFYSEGKTASW